MIRKLKLMHQWQAELQENIRQVSLGQMGKKLLVIFILIAR